MSLRWKVTALMIALVAVGALAASTIHQWFALGALRADVRGRAASVASQIAYGISEHELRDRDLLAVETRNILAARPTLRWLEVYASRPEGLLLTVTNRRPASPEPSALVRRAVAEQRTVTAEGAADQEEAWVAAAPVYLGGRVAGAVALAMSQEGAQRLADTLREQLLFVLLGTGFTIVAGLALFMERSVSRPIRALLRTMAAAEAGDLEAVPDVQRRDEMGDLADGLAKMLTRIRQGRDENLRLLTQISRFNEELQARVTEATRELLERNEAVRRANELLFDLQRQLNRAQRLATMGQLTARIAHEIGTPLNSVALHLQLLARSAGLTEQDRKRLLTIDGQIQRLVTTVQGLLASTRGAARQVAPADLNEIVRGMAELTAPVFASKKIHSTAQLDPALPKVLVDGHQIQQVLLNLLTNAVDAMPGGGSLTLSTRQDEGRAVLAVADTGPGVPAPARERIFDPFFTTKDRAGGSGLGLAICRQIVEAHGGTIGVQDGAAGGAVFEVALPLADAEAPA